MSLMPTDYSFPFELPNANLTLPENIELFIVPTILLTIGLAVLIFFWRARR